MLMPTTVSAITSQSTRVACASCALQTHCFTQRLDTEVLDVIEKSISTRRVARGTYAYRLCEPFNALYFIHQGFFKNVVLNEDGQEFITGFPMPGDVLGLDGCADGYYRSQSIALQDSTLCEISFETLNDLSFNYPPMQQILHRIMSREISRNQKSMLMLGNLPAEERLLAFLQELSQQFAMRGMSTNDFDLPMSRDDIAGYLGLKMETVSRAFTKLHTVGLIHVHRRRVRIDAVSTA